MALGSVRLTFNGLEDADAGRLAAAMESAVASDVPGANALRVRTDPSHMDLGAGVLISFVTEGAVVLAFKVIEKVMDRRAKNARLMIDIGELTPELALVIARDIPGKYLSPGLAAEVEKLVRPSA